MSAPIDQATLSSLLDAVAAYFDLMHDCDVSRFDATFAPSVQLHGFRDGAMVVWTADAYRAVLARRQSPQSLGARRVDEVLLVDFASATQAFTKVRLRIVATVFVDYLTWHRIDGRWLVTAKGFHLLTTDAG